MKVEIVEASLRHSEEDGYIGKLILAIEGHSQEYEMTLHSKKGRDWGYGLFFREGSGDEEQLLELEDEIEENDDLFYRLVGAVKEMSAV